MNLKLPKYASLSLLTLCLGCNQTTTDTKVDKPKQENYNNDNNQSSTIIEEPAPTNSELAFRQWDLPKDLDNTWVDAKEIIHTDTIHFDNIDASILFSFTTLSKDTSNHIIKNARITLLKNPKNYLISAGIINQINRGKKDARNHYITALVEATIELKPRNFKVERLNLIAHAKDGKIEKF